MSLGIQQDMSRMHLNIKKTKEESPKMIEGFLRHEAKNHPGNKLKLEENRRKSLENS